MFHSIQNKAKHVDTYRWWTWTQKA